jgi:hypothetical protein
MKMKPVTHGRHCVQCTIVYLVVTVTSFLASWGLVSQSPLRSSGPTAPAGPGCSQDLPRNAQASLDSQPLSLQSWPLSDFPSTATYIIAIEIFHLASWAGVWC